MDGDTGRRFAIGTLILLCMQHSIHRPVSHQAHAVNGVWNTATIYNGEKSHAILFWSYITSEEVTSITIIKGEDDITSSLSTSKKYRLKETKTTKGIKITLAVNNLAIPDSDVYRCSLDQLGDYKDIHLKRTDLMPELNPVISTLHQSAELVWEYNNHGRHPANQLIFARQNTEIARWSINEGSSVEDERFKINRISDNTTEIDVIKLTISKTIMEDFNKTYYCKLFSDGQNILMSGIRLGSKPEWVNPRSTVTAGLGEEVTFTWQYKYIFQARNISLTQRRETSANVEEDIGYWQNTELSIFPRYRNLVKMNRITSGEGGIIQLTIWNTTNDLFDSWYKCLITFYDGQAIEMDIKLIDVMDTENVYIIISSAVVGTIFTLFVIWYVIKRRRNGDTVFGCCSFIGKCCRCGTCNLVFACCNKITH